MSDRSRLRLIVLRVLVLSLLLTLLGRLWYLQVLAGPQYQQAAADNQVRDIVAAAPRGVIVDDNGKAWATNQAAGPARRNATCSAGSPICSKCPTRS